MPGRVWKGLLLPVSALFFLASTVSAAELTGEEIIRKSQDAYLALRSYVGTSTVTSTMVISAATVTQSASATISFLRPDRIRIEGRDAQNQPFAVVSDGTQTWLAWAPQSDGRFRQVDTLEMAVSAMTGVGAQAPTTIPAALIPFRWGYPWGQTSGAQLAGRENVDGARCYKVVIKTPAGSALAGTRTFWVDPKSFLLRRLKEEQDERDLAQMQATVQQMMEERAAKAPGAEKEQMDKIREMLKAPVIKSRETVQSFRIERVNATLDAALFEDPTR